MRISRKHRSAVAAFLVLAAPATLIAQPDGGPLQQAWATPAELQTPESALWDPDRGVIYVSNIAGNPTEKDGNGFISRVSPEGEILELEWVAGLDAPKGLGIHEGRLFAADIDRLVEIDIEQGRIVQSWPAEGAVFLNDVAVDARGTVYVSDFAEEHSAVYRLSDRGLELWVQDERLARPNGLLALEEVLIAGNARAELLRIPYASREISVLVDLSDHLGGIDGIARQAERSLLVSDWSGIVVRVDADLSDTDLSEAGRDVLGAAAGQSFQVTPLLDLREQEINTADIGVMGDENLLLVPTFFDNRVIAYRLPAGQ